MAACPHVIERSEVRDLLQMRDTAAVHNGHADVVNPLVADQVVRVPYGVENFANGKWRRGVPADDLESLLKFGGCRVFEPEQVKRLQLFAETPCFDGREAMVAVVE